MDKVYLSFQKNVEVKNSKILVGDIASVWCNDKHVLAKVKAITLIKVPETESRRYTVSALKVISLIEKEVKDVDIESMGEVDFIVSYKREKDSKKIMDICKVFFASIIIFCGSAFAIMAYENDIDINGIFDMMNKWISGGTGNGVLIEQITYSIGLTLGILIFYNRLGKRKCVKDPTPLDIQMRLYEDDINAAIISKSEREERIDDV